MEPIATPEEAEPLQQNSRDEGRPETKNCEEMALADTEKLCLLAELG
jgi:hypothetical protein